MAPAALAAAAALVAILMADGAESPARDDAAAPRVAPAISAPSPKVRGAGPMARGAASAPVVMVMYSEFQCPFCGAFSRETEPALIERFVEGGTLRIEWRDMPYLGSESFLAAAAGRAAADQGAFWELAERIFGDQPAPNSGQLTTEHLVAVAGELGLDTERFRRVMEDGATRAAVQADLDEAISLGVTGTPAFFVNGEVIIGAQPLQVFVDAIERAAATAG